MAVASIAQRKQPTKRAGVTSGAQLGTLETKAKGYTASWLEQKSACRIDSICLQGS